MGKLILSSVGQADDTGLLSNDIHKLMHILQLCLDYCLKYDVQLSSTKTKLMKFSPPRRKTFVPHNPIRIDGEHIKFVDQAEHVGVLRSTCGNLPNILERVASFKKALGSILVVWQKEDDLTQQQD